MARLKPVQEGGTVTFAGQTHPADGNAGMIITTPDRARALSRDPNIGINIIAFGQAREEPAYMPAAPIPGQPPRPGPGRNFDKGCQGDQVAQSVRGQ